MAIRNKKILNIYYKTGEFGYWFYSLSNRLFLNWKNRGSDESVIRRKYKKIHGYYPNLKNPLTLNEKLLWLKLYNRKDFHTICADKYAVRNYIEDKFGSEILIPLLFQTKNYKEINKDILPDYPCIIKASHSQGDMLIVRDKNLVNLKKLRKDCRIWLDRNLYEETQEWQYKNCTPRIIVEKLLLDEEGHIPNDYKLHFFNGDLKFIYCSVDREGENKRNIYDAFWNPLYFSWVEPHKDTSSIRGNEIEAPNSFEEMKRIGRIIAKDFPYVRVDFYDVNGKLYFGEITLYHGGGLDVFKPESFDLEFGKLLKLPNDDIK